MSGSRQVIDGVCILCSHCIDSKKTGETVKEETLIEGSY